MKDIAFIIIAMRKIIPAIVLMLFFAPVMVNGQQYDVLVIGGGIGGTAAGIQSARSGASTVLVEEGPWLGGMLSAAGVSAIDGNHELPSGLWGEFRNRIYAYYGGPSKVATGWVSNTQFEPRVADSILKSMTAAEKKLRVIHGYTLEAVIREMNGVVGARFREKRTGSMLVIRASQTIDATELGDAMAMAKVPYSLGMESGAVTGETVGVRETNNIVQDLTYVAILKDYGKGKDCTIVKPKGYDPSEFDGSNTNFYKDRSRKAPNVDAKKMLDYGRLPNNKYMLNWPIYGNDTYLNVVEMSPAEREKALEEAKQTTLRFVYFVQRELGYQHLGLTDDEFPTADRLALIPYHREGRRLIGMVRFNMLHIADPFKYTLYRTGISVGDYPIDHHHKKNPRAPQQLEFYPVPSFNIPLAALIPEKTDGLIVAEKGISVTNVANGTTRLQPVVMLTGQAAGALAALSATQKKMARNIPVRDVQKELLRSGVYLMPYNDVKPDHPQFLAIQRIGATGILKGKPTPHAWANQTWFYPDSLVNTLNFLNDAREVLNIKGSISSPNLTVADLTQLLQPLYSGSLEQKVHELNRSWGWKDAEPSRPVTRGECARMLDELFKPFDREINHFGAFK